MPRANRHLKENPYAEPIHYMQTQTDIRLSTHTRALLALGMVLASTLVSAQTLPEVKEAESNGTLDASFGTGGK
jgi:hypothetical protein